MATIIGGITSSIAGLLALYILFWIIIPTARGAGTAGVKGAVKYLFAVLIVIFLAGIFIPPVIDSTFLRLKSWGQKSPITHEVGSIVGYADEAGLTGEGTTFRDALSLNLAPGASLPGGSSQQLGSAASIDPLTGQMVVPQGSSAPAAPQAQYVLIGNPANEADLPQLKQCWSAWFTSPIVNGPAKLTQGFPPEGGVSATEWLPSGTGSATLEVEAPFGFGNNTGVLTHWLLPSTYTLEQEALKSIADDGAGIYEIQPTGVWPHTCYREVLPTVESPVTAAPPANGTNAGGGGPQTWTERSEGLAPSEWILYAADGVTESRRVPKGTDLKSCGLAGEFLMSCVGGAAGAELFRDPSP